jgi:hypothetical protein
MAQLPNKGESMSFPVIVIQTLAAFAIFVAGYFMLLVSIICVLVLAGCIYKGGRIICRRFALPNGVFGYTPTEVAKTRN